MRIGEGETNNPAACIFPPTQKCYDVGAERAAKLQRGHISGRKSAHPQYVLLRPSQLGRYIWAKYRFPDFLNKLVRSTMEMALEGLIYQDTSQTIHINISNYLSNEAMGHERGREEARTTKKWHNVCEERTTYYIRWVDDIAMRRDHLVRMIRDLEQAEETGEEYDLNGERRVSELTHNDWGIRRDGTKSDMEFPLLDKEAWDRIKVHSWLDWGD